MQFGADYYKKTTAHSFFQNVSGMDLKQDMQFRRYLSKGTSNVLAESTLLAIARNINKLHNKIQNEKTGMHLFPLKSA